jgi:hypothetical protein
MSSDVLSDREGRCMEIRTDELTRDHLVEFSEIEVVCGLADEPVREVVWRRTPSILSVDLMKTLRVRVRTLSPEQVGALIAKIEGLESSLR